MQQVRTVQGDTWDILALKLYGDEKLMDVLIKANFNERHRVVFPSNVILNVPEVETKSSTSENLPSWMRLEES